jgi:hypothetical protein
MKGRLNLFQRTMLRWRALHPYNAVHVLRIDAPLDVARLRAAIARVLEGEGLTGLRLELGRGRYEYAGGVAAVSLAVLPAGADATETVTRAIERELNATFPREGSFDPFRFFAVADGNGFHLGLGYDHFIAGGDSIVVLMKDLYDAYVDGGHFTPRRLDLYPTAYGRLFARHAGRLVTGLPGLVEMLRSCRTTARPDYREGVPPTNAFLLRTVDPVALARALRVAKQWGVTQNDLLLALLLQAMAPLAGERRSGRRRAMAAASIINIRGDFQPPATAVFGQFLSSFRVTHPMPAGQDLAALARDVGVQTRRTKQRKLYLQTLLGIAGSGLAWRFLSPEVRATFHAKNYPVWGGVTLLNVDALWRGAGGGAPPDYFRGVPTGPMAPLVVAASTVNGALHLGFSWRVAAFDRETMDNIAARIVADLRSLSDSA